MGDALARRLVEVGGLDAQGVDAAVHVGVGVGVEVDEGIDHLPRLLGGGGIVEIDQRSTIDLALKDGEVGANAVDVQGHGLGRVEPEHGEIIPFWSELARRRSS